MSKIKKLRLTEKERRKLRGILYGVRIGGFLRGEDYVFLREIERRLAPSHTK